MNVNIVLKNETFLPIGTILLLISIFLTAIKSQGQQIQIDHVITLVSDLDDAVKFYSDQGFTIKHGKLHQNGLKNAHIKFQNKSSFELMSLQGPPTDAIARNYKSLLNEKEGGVYLALSGVKTDSLEILFSTLNIEFESFNGKSWNYVTFPKASPLSHIFFIEYHINSNDPKNLLIHKNGSYRIDEVILEGNDILVNFLFNIGLKSIIKKEKSSLGKGFRFNTHTGDISIIPLKNNTTRPRIKIISFSNQDGQITKRLNL